MVREFDSGSHQLTINASDSPVTLDFIEGSQGTLILYVEGNGALDIAFNYKDNSRWTYLWVNKSPDALEIKEIHNMGSGVDLKANFAELSLGAHKKLLMVMMQGSNAHFHMKGASMAFNALIWDIQVHHEAKRTFANLENYAIVSEKGRINMEVSGQIDNGYSGSETHQMTRIMNLGDDVNAVVFPKLLIRENDVAASHAATVGQPDEEHVYYLQARGMTRIQALKLLTKGYLMPIVVDIEDEAVKNELIEEIEKKVETQWNQ